MNINEPIQNMINHTINQIPKPQKIHITKVYPDNQHIDCKTLNNDTLEYIPIIANNPTTGNTGILLTLENDEKIVITKWNKNLKPKIMYTKAAHTEEPVKWSKPYARIYTKDQTKIGV